MDDSIASITGVECARAVDSKAENEAVRDLDRDLVFAIGRNAVDLSLFTAGVQNAFIRRPAHPFGMIQPVRDRTQRGREKQTVHVLRLNHFRGLSRISHNRPGLKQGYLGHWIKDMDVISSET